MSFKVKDYLSNLSKSVTYAATEITKDLTPNLNKVYTDNEASMKKVFEDIKKMKPTLDNIKSAQEKYIFKPVNYLIDNLKEDIKTGQFYGHESRADSYMDIGEMLASLLGDMDESDEIEAEANGETITTSSDDDSRVHGVPEVTKGDLVVSKAAYGASMKSAQAISTTIAKSTEAELQLTKTIGNLQLSSLGKQASIMLQGFNNLNKGMQALVGFNDQVAITHYQNSRTFFEQMTNFTAENNAILKEMLEMQRIHHSVLMGDGNDRRNASIVDKILGTSAKGKFNLQDYASLVKDRFDKTSLGSVLGMLKMFPMFIGSALANPMGFVTQQVLSSLIDGSLKKAIRGIDESITGFVTTALAKLHDYSKKHDGILGSIAGIFGLKSEKFKLSEVDTSKYNKGTMAWNGIAQKVLVEVIPGHLRRIEAAITGDAERIFDLNSGKWQNYKTISSLQKDINRETRNYVFKDEISKSRAILRSAAQSKEQKTQYNKQALQVFQRMANEDKASVEDLLTLRDQGKMADIDQTVFAVVKAILESDKVAALNKQAKYNEVHEMQRNYYAHPEIASSNMVSEALNGGYNEKYSKSRNSFGGGLAPSSIFDIVDDDNKSIMDYNRIIATEARTIRELLERGNTTPINYGYTSDNPPPPPNNPPAPPSDSNVSSANDAWSRSSTLRNSNEPKSETNRSPYLIDNENHAIRLNSLYARRERQLNAMGIDSDQLEDLAGLINPNDPDQSNALSELLQQRIEASKIREANGGLFSSLFEGLSSSADKLGLSELSDRIKDSKNDNDRLKKLANTSILKMPQAALANVLEEANMFMYDILFGKTDEKDVDGKPILGFWGKMTNELRKGMDVFTDHVQKVVTNLFDPENGILKKAYGWFKDFTGINFDEYIDKGKKAVQERARKVGRSVTGALKSTAYDIKDSFVETFLDIYGRNQDIDDSIKEKETKNKGLSKEEESAYQSQASQIFSSLMNSSEANAYGKLVKNVPGTVITTLSPGEAVIPAPLNPWNKNRSKANPLVQQKQEESLITKFKSGLKNTVSDFAKNYTGPGANKLTKFVTNATGTTSQEEETTEQQEDPKQLLEKQFIGFMKKVIQLSASNKGKISVEEAIKQVGNSPEFIALTHSPEFATFINPFLSRRNNLPGNTRYGKLNRQITTGLVRESGYQGHVDNEDESRRLNYASHDSIWNNINQFVYTLFGTDVEKAASATNKALTKSLPEISKGSVVGGLASTIFTSGGPVFGAMAGIAATMIKKNKTAMEYLFGKEIADGERDNSGLLSNKFVKSLQKYIPDIKKYGTVGSIAGLVLPFGPLGGLLGGIAASYVKNNEGFQRFLFGDAEGKGGIFDKDLKEKIKKKLPKIAAGAVAGLFLGPWGLLGNAVIGSGIGLYTTTESFKRLVLGVPDKNGRRYGGIADVLSHEVVKPLQRSMKQFSNSFSKWFKDDFFNPLAGALKPVATYMKGQLKDSIRSTTTYLFKTIKERFGIVDKISEYTDKLFSFGRRGLGKITEFIGNLGVGKKIGDKLRSLRDKSVSTFGRANYERGYDYDYDETLDDRVQKARKMGWNDKDSVMYNYENAINSRSKSDLSEDMDQELIQLRDSIKQYRSNKRIISNTRNKALRDARDELKSTGYRMARRYEASGEDLVHPYTAKKKILYFVKKISNISGADGDKALLNIADIETELRQEEDKLNNYIKNTNAIEELSTTDEDKEKNYKEILKLQAQIDTLGKPELTQPLIDELRQLLNTSGREISKLENTRDVDINKEEYKKQNDEILKAFARQIGMKFDPNGPNADKMRKKLEAHMMNENADETINHELYRRKKAREDAAEKARIAAMLSDNETKETSDETSDASDGAPSGGLDKEDKENDKIKVSRLTDLVNQMTDMIEVVTGKKDTSLLDKKAFDKSNKELIAAIEHRNALTDVFFNNIGNVDTHDMKKGFVERTADSLNNNLVVQLADALANKIPLLKNYSMASDLAHNARVDRTQDIINKTTGMREAVRNAGGEIGVEYQDPFQNFREANSKNLKSIKKGARKLKKGAISGGKKVKDGLVYLSKDYISDNITDYQKLLLELYYKAMYGNSDSFEEADKRIAEAEERISNITKKLLETRDKAVEFGKEVKDNAVQYGKDLKSDVKELGNKVSDKIESAKNTVHDIKGEALYMKDNFIDALKYLDPRIIAEIITNMIADGIDPDYFIRAGLLPQIDDLSIKAYTKTAQYKQTASNLLSRSKDNTDGEATNKPASVSDKLLEYNALLDEINLHLATTYGLGPDQGPVKPITLANLLAGGNANMPYPAIQTSGGPVAPPVTLTNLLSGYNNASTSDIHTNALGTLGSIALNAGKNIGGKIIGSFLGNNDKEEKEPTDSITKAASSFNSTADELNEASEAISARSNDTLKSGKSDNKEHKKGEVWYDTDANGNSIAKTIGPDGTPMVVKNKDNEEVQKKQKYELNLKERSTAALEKIAANVKTEAIGTIKDAGKSAKDGLGNLLSGGLGAVGKLIDTLFLGLPIGTFFMNKLKTYLGKAGSAIFKLISGKIGSLVTTLKDKIKKRKSKDSLDKSREVFDDEDDGDEEEEIPDIPDIDPNDPEKKKKPKTDIEKPEDGKKGTGSKKTKSNKRSRQKKKAASTRKPKSTKSTKQRRRRKGIPITHSDILQQNAVQPKSNSIDVARILSHGDDVLNIGLSAYKLYSMFTGDNSSSDDIDAEDMPEENGLFSNLDNIDSDDMIDTIDQVQKSYKNTKVDQIKIPKQKGVNTKTPGLFNSLTPDSITSKASSAGEGKASQMLNSFKSGLQTIFTKLSTVLPSGKGLKEGINKFCSNLLTRLSSAQVIKKVAVKLAKSSVVAIPYIGAAISVAFVLKGFYDGYNNAEELWKVNPGEASTGMKLAAGISTAVGEIPGIGIFFSVLFGDDWLPELLKMVSSDIGKSIDASPEDVQKTKKESEDANKAVQKAGKDAYQDSQDINDATLSQAKGITESILQSAGDAARGIANKGAEFASAVSTSASSAWQFAKSTAKSAYTWVKDKIKDGAQTAKDMWAKAKDIGSSVYQKVSTTFSKLMPGGKGKNIETPIGGVPYNKYSMLNPEYANQEFNTNQDTEKQTLGDSGCSVFAALNGMQKAGGDISSLGKDPVELAKKEALKYKGKNDGVSPDFMLKFPRKFGFKTQLLTGKNSIEEAAKDPNSSVALMAHSDNNPESNQLYGSGGSEHWVSTNGFKNGKLNINDPQGNPNGDYNSKNVLRGKQIDSAVKISYPKNQNNKYTQHVERLLGMGKWLNVTFRYGKGANDTAKGAEIWAYLKSKGLSSNAISGIMGNMAIESGLVPARVQDKANGGFITAPEITVDGSTGYGLCQWTYRSRQQGLVDFAKARGTSTSDMATQLDYMLQEINSTPKYQSVIEMMDKASGPAEAAKIFHDVFEGSADAPDKIQLRGQKAEEIFKSEGKGEAFNGSYKVSGSSGGNSPAKKDGGLFGTLSEIATIFQNIFNPFSSNDSSGGSSGGSFSSQSSDANIRRASEWANSMVGKTGYGNNGCTEFSKRYLLQANNNIGKYMEDGSPVADKIKSAAATNGDVNNPTLMYVPTLEKFAKDQNIWKDGLQPGSEGDLCVCNNHGHAIIADGKGGYWGNSSSRNKIVHGSSISNDFGPPNGYIATGSGGGAVSNGQATRTKEEMMQDAGSSNYGSGKFGRAKNNPLMGVVNPAYQIAQNKIKEQLASEKKVNKPDTDTNNTEDQNNANANVPATNTSSGSSGGIFGSILDRVKNNPMITKASSAMKNFLSTMGSKVMSSAFGSALKLLYGDNNPLAGLLGIGSSGSSSNGRSGGPLDTTTVDVSGSASQAIMSGMPSTITAEYGEDRGKYKHNGIDYGVPEGTGIPSPVSGTVYDVGFEGGYGKYVQIQDKKGNYHIFAHCSDNSLVSKGQSIKPGDIIAKSGNTGHSTGPHLHYSITPPDNPGATTSGPSINPHTYSVSSLGAGKYKVDEPRQRKLEEMVVDSQRRILKEANKQARERIFIPFSSNSAEQPKQSIPTPKPQVQQSKPIEPVKPANNSSTNEIRSMNMGGVPTFIDSNGKKYTREEAMASGLKIVGPGGMVLKSSSNNAASTIPPKPVEPPKQSIPTPKPTPVQPKPVADNKPSITQQSKEAIKESPTSTQPKPDVKYLRKSESGNKVKYIEITTGKIFTEKRLKDLGIDPESIKDFKTPNNPTTTVSKPSDSIGKAQEAVKETKSTSSNNPEEKKKDTVQDFYKKVDEINNTPPVSIKPTSPTKIEKTSPETGTEKEPEIQKKKKKPSVWDRVNNEFFKVFNPSKYKKNLDGEEEDKKKYEKEPTDIPSKDKPNGKQKPGTEMEKATDKSKKKKPSVWDRINNEFFKVFNPSKYKKNLDGEEEDKKEDKKKDGIKPTVPTKLSKKPPTENSISKAQEIKNYNLGREGSHGNGPNGLPYSNNDILYLLKNGYTLESAIELLSKDKKYTTPLPKPTDIGKNGKQPNEDKPVKKDSVTTPTGNKPKTPKSTNTANKPQQQTPEDLAAKVDKTNELLASILNAINTLNENFAKGANSNVDKSKNNSKTNDAFYAEMMKNKASNNLNVGLPNGNVDMNFFNPDLSKSIDVVKRMDYIASR